MIRLVATDLDGTLLRRKPPISPRTVAAVQAVEAAGITVVLVTGRPPRAVHSIARELGANGFAICGNGAIVYDLARREIVTQDPIPPGAVAELVRVIRAALPGAMFAWEAGLQFGRDDAYHAVALPVPPPHDLAMTVGDPADAAAGTSGFTKLLVRHPELREDEITERVAAAVGDLALVTSAGAPFAELSAPGVHKASALERLCADHGIAAEEVLAFGDGPNDLPMLQWAGRAVAMANAHPTVLAEIGEVTASNEEDGVAAVLESLLSAWPR